MKKILLPLFVGGMLTAKAQLVIDNATFFIGEGAVVTVEGNLTTNVAIQAGGAGAAQGKIVLKGASQQTITTNGFVIPSLQIDNASNAVLSGDVRVSNRIEFTNGKFQLGSANFILENAAVVTGAGTSKFFETDGTGEVRKLIAANGTVDLPMGNGTDYTPLNVVVAGSTFAADAYVGGRSSGAFVANGNLNAPVAAAPTKHPRTESFLNTAWRASRSGITGGTVTGTGTYVDGDITGTESDIFGMVWNGTTWALGNQNNGANTVAGVVPSAGGTIYGMNKFVLTNVKTFLQGAYDAGTGLMRDVLRSNAGVYTAGNAPVSSVLPTNDPYRGATYIATFAHTSNALAETIASSVLNNTTNPGDNIVDWVFLELRTNASPSTVLQSRAALIQRDGDIVDIDGVNPIYFKNLDAATYHLSIKHRNHIAVRTATGNALSLTTPLALNNLSTAGANYLNGFSASLAGGTVFGLYGGNSNRNGNVRVSGADATTSDFESIKLELGSSAIKNNGYFAADLNMNRNVRVSGADATTSDFEFLKSVLGSSAIRTQPTQ